MYTTEITYTVRKDVFIHTVKTRDTKISVIVATKIEGVCVICKFG